jgi:hypothetical protein
MVIDDFKTYPKWITLLKEKAEECDLAFNGDPANSRRRQSYYFKITSDTAAVIGKTHHSNQFGRREKNKIEEEYKVTKESISSSTDLYPEEDQFDQIEILAVVINHESVGEYNPETDDFLVLDEEAFEDIPPSGKKQFAIKSDGYAYSFGDHVDGWDRIFELFESSCR